VTAATTESSNADWESLLAALRDQLSAFSATLADENTSVRDFDADTLERVLAEKSQSLLTLEQLDRTRRERLAARGLSDTRTGVEHMSAGSKVAGATWEEIEQLTRNVRHAMEANAALLHAHQRLTVDALATIYADQGEPALYEHGASMCSQAPVRSLGRA
jgi:flagellar biosynthesis/type III secretory pathway chaperone